MAVCFPVAIFRHAGVIPVVIHVYLDLAKKNMCHAKRWHMIYETLFVLLVNARIQIDLCMTISERIGFM